MTTLPSGSARIGSWIAQLIAAGILAQAAFFKLTSAPESIALFGRLGVDPWGRYAVGIYEGVTALLLLIPRTALLGGLLAAGLMIGAIGTHLLRLGLAINGDPSMFIMALATLGAALVILLIRRTEWPFRWPPNAGT